MKVCIKCGVEKELSEFHKDRSIKGGYKNTCKSCKKVYQQKYREDNKESIKAYQDDYYTANKESKKAYYTSNKESIILREQKYRENNKESITLKRKKYREVNRELLNGNKRQYREDNPDKISAHNIVNKTIKRGDLIRQPCEVCGDAHAQAHHDDYTKPLKVRWLCQKHHSEWHKFNTPIRAPEYQ